MRKLIIFIVLLVVIITQYARCDDRDENLYQAGKYLSSYSNMYFTYKVAEVISAGAGYYGYKKNNNIIMIVSSLAILAIEWSKITLPIKIGKAGKCLRRASVRF